LTAKQVIANPNSLGKNQRLKSRKLIGQLFKEGKSVSVFPFRVLYLPQPEAGELLQAGFSVSSKNFRKAVDRNRIKRLMREAYRLQKLPLKSLLEKKNNRLVVFLIYTGKEMPDYEFIYEKVNVVLQTIIKKLDAPVV
jgi:ribonuclease P protein component